jgi:hypothetical protein
VQQASKHNGLIDAKEKIEKNVRDFRAKIPAVKVENMALRNYLEKANETVLSLIPYMQNVQAEIHDGISSSAKVETLMEAMTSKTNIHWSKEIKEVAKSIKVKQLNIKEVRHLNLKSVVSALARVAKEEKEKARQKGRRGGVKNRGRPKTPNKVKEKVTVNQGETQEGDDGDEQPTPKRNTRSRTANIKGKEKFVEDEVDAQKDVLPTDNPQSQPKKIPRLKIVSRESQTDESKREPKRKRVEQPIQDQLPDIKTEVQDNLPKRKRVQENLSTASTPTQSTDITEVQEGRANTESSAPASAASITSMTTAKRNNKRGKRKRAEEPPSEVTVEEERKQNNNDQTSASMPSDEVTKSVPVKRQYRRTRKSTNKEKKKADEQTPTSTSNLDQASASDSIQVKKPTKRARKSAKPNETAEDATNTNDAVATANVTSKKTRRKGKTITELRPKLRLLAPKTEEKGEGSTFHVVLNINKHKNDSTNSDPMEDTSNEVVTTTSMHSDTSNVVTAIFDHNSRQDNVNKVESNEENSSNTRSGIGISTLLNPIEETSSSTSTVYEASAQTYLYEAVNASTNKQNYFGGNENLYQSSTSNNNLPIQNNIMGFYRYGATSSSSTSTTNAGRTHPYEKHITSFRVPLNVGVNESGLNPYTSYNQGAYPSPYFNPRNATNYSFSPYTPMNQCMPYSNVNENRASNGTFTNMTNNNSNSTFTNVTNNRTSTGTFTNTTNSHGLNALLSAVNFVELKAPETNSFVAKESHKKVEPISFVTKENRKEVEPTSLVTKENHEVEPTSFVAKENEVVEPTTLVTQENNEEVEPSSFVAEENHEEVEPPSFVAEENHEVVKPPSFIVQENNKVIESSSLITQEDKVKPPSFVAQENNKEVEPLSFVAQKNKEVEPHSFAVQENDEEVEPLSIVESNKEVEPIPFVAQENNKEVEIESRTKSSQIQSQISTPSVSFYGGYTSTIKANPSGEVATSYQSGSVSFLSFTGPSTFSFTSTIITQDDNAAAETLPGSSKRNDTRNIGTAPVETVPVETVPIETAPIETAPIKVAPVETVPKETIPKETASMETAPIETAQIETAPIETEAVPMETAPVETPAETASVKTDKTDLEEDPVSPSQEITSNEELAPAQNTVIKRRKRGPAGIKKKAGRKPKAKPLEDEAERIPVPQPTCSVCDLVVAPTSDSPSKTCIKPQRARDSMLLKGRDKVNQMVRCGYCNKWYHLACMIPPRRTMPNTGYVWRCADCDQPSASTGESPSSGDAPSAPKTSKKWNLRSATK